MLENIKTWIEGLFRPTITTTVRGAYINRTPTIYDLYPIYRHIYTRTTGGVETVDTDIERVPDGKVQIIRGAYCRRTDAIGDSGTIIPFVDLIDTGLYTPVASRSNYVAGAGSIIVGELGFYGAPMFPLVLQPGTRYYLTRYHPAAGTYQSTIYYNEVNL